MLLVSGDANSPSQQLSKSKTINKKTAIPESAHNNSADAIQSWLVARIAAMSRNRLFNY